MTTTEIKSSCRIEWIDIARGVALVAMAIYHFCWDLEFFGYLDPGTAESGFLRLFARSIASSFLILVGVSILLAHFRGIRWPGFWKRLAMVTAAAAAITIATYFATPDAYVFFGILHEIALASVLGLLFLRVPAIGLLAIAVLWFFATGWLRGDLFSSPWLVWLGLSPQPPRTNDFVPVFPWFAAVLLGMALGRLMIDRGWTKRLAEHPPRPNPVTPVLAFLGRHSLVTYLVHQPILIACVYLFSLLFPAPAADPAETMFRSCERTCVENSTEEQCTAFCGCAIAKLTEQGLFDDVASGAITQASDNRVTAVTTQCAFEAGIYGN